jgi:hypothetical protein
MEIETMYLFILCTSIIGFFIGNLVSPSTDGQKKKYNIGGVKLATLKNNLKRKKERGVLIWIH